MRIAQTFFNRFRFASSRELGVVAVIALAAAVAFDRLGPEVAFNQLCVGVLFGFGVGLGVFALGAFARERARR